MTNSHMRGPRGANLKTQLVGHFMANMTRSMLIVAWSLVLCHPLVAETPRCVDVKADHRREFDDLSRQMIDRSWCQRIAQQVAHHAALILETDRDPADVVLRRTAVLLAYIQTMSDAPNLYEHADQLKQLQTQNRQIAVNQKTARYELFEHACQLRRRVAFQNPLLDFDQIIFLTKHRPMRGDHHMVDQYYGFNARPGGGIHVLSNPFGDQPEVRNLLTESIVKNGRLSGQRLIGGAFNTLDLDFDGQTILFAWSQCGEPPADANWHDQPWSKTEARDKGKPYYYWCPETTFHLFHADVDGSNLKQLTDSKWNDFDPVFLPSGRVAFISERRGGYLRCGGNRPNPTYTLYGMMSDGTDVIPLSYHETQEWNPSVDNNGMIAYTRWDYVDRDNDGAHHIWLCYPDGRDPRSYHGNYPIRRENRPWMELAIRAIPDSHKYVAVAAAHHGYNYGTLVLIDPSVPDDNAMSQLKRLTPEAHFPESESAPGQPHKKGRHTPSGEVYGTPWPLSEEFSLCVFDSSQKNYGIYLVDCFGNKELIWRDPNVACLDPIPLRARQRPPVLPAGTTQALADQQPSADQQHSTQRTAAIAVMNVYESEFSWPKGTQIKAIRVIQLFPKSTYHMDNPEVGLANESLTRGVLGTAPVEVDGSAFFEAPPGALIYFQALNEQGRAVQSMRSATYVHPGEQMTCVGCHEDKRRSPTQPTGTPLALRRAPSQLSGNLDGTYPISYPQLVQPVLDRCCVDCHREKKALNLTGEPSKKHGWTRSYVSLAPFAWGLSGGNGIISKNGMRSVPGEVGAQASKLMKILDAGHYDVELSDDDLRRIIVWLDCNSNFYGAYYDLKKQASGKKVMPKLQ